MIPQENTPLPEDDRQPTVWAAPQMAQGPHVPPQAPHAAPHTPPPPAYPVPVYYPAPVLGPAPHTRTSGKAVTALVLGIAGIILLPIICSTLAIIFGSIARGETRRDPSLGGRGMATAGLVLGIIGVVIFGLIIVAIAAG